MRALPCKRLLAATVAQRDGLGRGRRWEWALKFRDFAPIRSQPKHTRLLPLLRSATRDMQHIRMTAANLRVKRKKRFQTKRKNICRISLETGDTLTWNWLSSETMENITADSHLAAALSGSSYCSRFWFEILLNILVMLVMLVITIPTCADGMGHRQRFCFP